MRAHTFLFFLFLLGTSAQAAPTLTVGTTTQAAGTTVDIPVSYSTGGSAVTGLQFDVSLPPALPFVSAVIGSAGTAAGKLIACNALNPMTCLVFGINVNVIGQGPVAIIRLNIPGGTAAGPYPITLSNTIYSDALGNGVTGSPNTNGSVLVTGAPPPPNNPPTVATPASASPSPVTGTTTNLSVLGADDGGEPALTYTWTTTGSPPASVAFSANGTNVAKNTTATFTKSGSYSFRVTIQDLQGLTVTSSVNVTVNATLTTITVSPPSASVVLNATQAFSATGFDQFGQALGAQPSFTWTVSGGGSINSSGLFTADNAAGGPVTVTTASGGKSGTAQVTVTASPPPPPPPPPPPLLPPVTQSAPVSTDLSAVEVYPNPWRSDKHAGRGVTFANLSSNASVKIFTMSGRLARNLGIVNGQVTWDLRDDAGDSAASGIYVYVVSDNQGNKAKGKVVVIK